MSWQRITGSLLIASTFYLYSDDQKQPSLPRASSESPSDIGAMTNLPPAEIAFQLDFHTSVDTTLQRQLEQIDTRLRMNYSIASTQTALGVLDLTHGRLAMIHPDEMKYAASVAKLGILLAYFELNPDAAGRLDAATRHDLGLMAKTSSNDMASKFSHELGLRQIQGVLDHYGFYDREHGGGIWVGKHYGKDSERIGDPLGNNSHAVTVRQLLRFYLLLDQKKLVSPVASRAMLEILASPDLPHDKIKFVKGLEGRNVEILRKWGTWEDWLHDSAIISGPDRRYVLVGLTHHAKGDEYLAQLASEIDDLMTAASHAK